MEIYVKAQKKREVRKTEWKYLYFVEMENGCKFSSTIESQGNCLRVVALGINILIRENENRI